MNETRAPLLTILAPRWIMPLLLLGAVLLPSPSLGKSSARTETVHLATPHMPQAVKVRMWLPPGFDAAQPGSIPLLVFLHDGFGSERSFVRKGLAEILDAMVLRGEVTGFAVACPRTVGTFNSNDRLGKHRINDVLTEDLVPGLLGRYPQLRRDAEGRGLTGISMGGYGSLKIALRDSALFPSVSALSPWIEDLSFDRQRGGGLFMRWAMGRVFGKTRETSTIRSESLFVILQALTGPPVEPPRLLLITGEDDPSVHDKNLERLEAALRAKGVPFETKLYPGKHEWSFWRAHFAEIVRFHAARFAGAPAEE